jgi:hypothetical protein
VLIACEFSGIVRDAFIAAGHDAVSCDLLPSERPGPHIQGDVLEVLEDGWDMLIAFPPCTYLCSSGLHWNKRRPERAQQTHEAMLFVFNLLGEGFISHDIPRIALENPIGCISTNYRKPDQIIQPWMFGHDASKATCLKNLWPLVQTDAVEPMYGCCGARFPYALGKYGCPNCNGDKVAKAVWGNQTPSGQNNLGPSDTRAMERSRTYQGIADAMAEQWGRVTA